MEDIRTVKSDVSDLQLGVESLEITLNKATKQNKKLHAKSANTNEGMFLALAASLGKSDAMKQNLSNMKNKKVNTTEYTTPTDSSSSSSDETQN